MHDIILNEIQQRWNDAAAIWDSKALARIYTSDAVFFGLLPRHYMGRAQVEEYFRSYEGVLQAVTLSLVDQNVRASFVVKKIECEWLIALHHFSNV